MVWQLEAPERLRKLIEGVPQRLEAVIKGNGRATPC